MWERCRVARKLRNDTGKDAEGARATEAAIEIGIGVCWTSDLPGLRADSGKYIVEPNRAMYRMEKVQRTQERNCDELEIEPEAPEVFRKVRTAGLQASDDKRTQTGE